jgi:hypothetical protein
LSLSLGGDSEEAFHESHLSLNVTFDHSGDLTFPSDVHYLIAQDRSLRCPETEEPESMIDSPFQKSMILFHHIVQIFALAQLTLIRQDAFCLQFLDRRRSIVWPVESTAR